MTLAMKTGLLSALCTPLLFLSASAHIQMSNPLPFRSSLNYNAPSQNVDYNMMAPLSADGSDFPCKGYHRDTNAESTATYQAGQQYSMEVTGSATHLGGSCQLSLSYDGGATFKVIKSIIGGCPITQKYDFTVPDFAPSGKALFAWTWLNFEGNREFYMNCAPVEITGSSGTSGSMDKLPNIWVANLASVNTCTLPSAQNAVFPNPGEDVVYGNGMSSSSEPSAGDCDGADPANSGSPVNAPAEGDGPDQSADFEPVPGNFFEVPPSSSVANQPSPAVTDTASSGAPSAPAMAPAPAVTPPVINNSANQPSFTTVYETESCTTHSDTASPQTVMTPPTSTLDLAGTTPTTLLTVVSPASEPTATAGSGTQTPTDTPPYATGDLREYLPCVPGTNLCTGTDSFVTCIQQSSSSDEVTYSSPRNVADGMLCLPFLSPFTDETAGSNNAAPSGFYRDDRYVRARPNGSCEEDGSIGCKDGGSGFLVCDHGGWVDMGRVANGTVCTDGKIVSA